MRKKKDTKRATKFGYIHSFIVSDLFTMAYRFDDQQQRGQLLNIVDQGTVEQLFVSEELMIIVKMQLFFFVGRPFYKDFIEDLFKRWLMRWIIRA